MIRIALALALLFAPASGSGYCYCTMLVRMSVAPVAVAAVDGNPAAPVCHCCGGAKDAAPRSNSVSPLPPLEFPIDCPCQKVATSPFASASTEEPGSDTGESQDCHVAAATIWQPLRNACFTGAGFTDRSQEGPFLTTHDLIYVHHRMRC